MVSWPFSESELRGVPSSSIKFLGVEGEGRGGIKDLTIPDVRTAVDATQGGANRHIQLTMQPTRPSLSDAIRILGRLNFPAAAK